MYIKTNWENEPSESTPINASNLNKIEQGIYDNSLGVETIGDITELDTTDKTSVVNAINEIVPTIGTNSIKIKNIGICWGKKNISFSGNAYTGQTINFPFTFINNNYAVIVGPDNPFTYFTEIRFSPEGKTSTSCKIGGYNITNTTINGDVDYLIIGTISD